MDWKWSLNLYCGASNRAKGDPQGSGVAIQSIIFGVAKDSLRWK